MSKKDYIHGTAVVFRGRGIVLLGKSKMGKSDLALRMIAEDGDLVSDDVVKLEVRGKSLYASAPKEIRNKIEVRGVGIVPMKAAPETKVDLIIHLKKKYDRLPKKQYFKHRGIKIPSYTLNAFESSILLKICLIFGILDE